MFLGRRYLFVTALVCIICNSAVKAQDLNALVYPQKTNVSNNEQKTDIQEVPFTHNLLNTNLYQGFKSSLAKAKQSNIRVKRTEKGDVTSFHVRDILQAETWNQVQSECIYVSDELVIWIRQEDKQLFTGSLGIPDLIDRLSYFLEEQTSNLAVDPTSGILDINEMYFGSPPNIDGDGRLDILLLDIEDQFEETGSYVAGFFDPVNLIDHPNSNFRDMIYVDLYPSVIYQGTMNTDQVAATIAHEYQHLVHANYEGEQSQSIFINEGLSELAEILCGFAPRKPDAYFHSPNRSLLSWNYSNPLPDYARASLFMEYLFEQVGTENTKKLVQTRSTGVEALQEVINNTSSLTLSQLFMNWGKAMLLNNRSINSAFGYKHPSRQNVRFSTGHVYNQLPEADNLSMPHLSHRPMRFPLTKELTLHTNNFDPNITITGKANYPDGSQRYIGSSQSGNAYFAASDNPYGSLLTLISNQEVSFSFQDSVETAYNFLATGRKSGEIVTIAYDDGIADAFSGHASYHLLEGTEQAYAVTFQTDEPA